MLSQDIDCQKCGFSNKLGTIYCRNCGTKLKFDAGKLDVGKNRRARKLIYRIINALIVIVILVAVAAAFWPWGFPEQQKITDTEEIKATITTCKEIDGVLTKSQGKADYEFSAPELTYAINYLAIEHERETQKRSKKLTFGSGGSSLGGVSDLGGANLGSKPSMQLKPKANAAPPQPEFVDQENARRQAWRKRKLEDRKNAGKRTDRSPHFDFTVTIKDQKTLGIIVKEKWLKYVPCRIELHIEPELTAAKEGEEPKLNFKITKAYLGHLPLPLQLKEYIIQMFEEVVMQEREWSKQYLKTLRNVQINDDLIKITIGQ